LERIMEVFLAENSGFCFGVKRAIKIAFQTAREGDGPVYTYGSIIHNPQVVNELEKKGVRPIDSLAEMKKGTVIIRSHGVPPRIISDARSMGITVVDATCPFVRKAQELASSLQREGYQVVVVGEADHPEVKGILGHAGPRAVVLDYRDSGADMRLVSGKIGVIAQTTLLLGRFQSTVSRLLEVATELKIYSTICSATALRQESTLNLAEKVDLMIVVGGKNSANTSRLAELCRDVGKDTYHIETAEELNPAWFRDDYKIGVTAGASTPDWIIEDVIEAIEAAGSQGAAVKGGRTLTEKGES
jgi:small subunit ribosomal protein S1